MALGRHSAIRAGRRVLIICVHAMRASLMEMVPLAFVSAEINHCCISSSLCSSRSCFGCIAQNSAKLRSCAGAGITRERVVSWGSGGGRPNGGECQVPRESIAGREV